MKKWIVAFILLGLVIPLGACSNSASKASSKTTASLSEQGQLLVGTLRLEDTDLAVTKDQAAKLIPLWETLQSLDSSGTAATEEVQAVVDQIKSTMTTQQVSNIAAMKLTDQDLLAAISANGAASTSSSTTSSSSTSGTQLQSGPDMGAPADAGAGGGNPPADMGGNVVTGASGGVSGSTAPQASSTQSAGSSASTTSNQIPPALINALVALLQKKAA